MLNSSEPQERPQMKKNTSQHQNEMGSILTQVLDEFHYVLGGGEQT